MYKNILNLYNKTEVSTIIKNSFTNNSKDLILQSNIGIHRTLTYIKPLLDFLENDQYPKLDLTLDDPIENSKLQKASLSKHGALIVLPHVYSINSLYSIIRQISPDLYIFRSNNFSDKAGVISYTSEGSEDFYKRYLRKCKENSLKWNIYSIALVTQEFIISLKNINPSIVILDTVEKQYIARYKCRFPDSKFIIVTSDSTELGGEKLKLDFPLDYSKIHLSSLSLPDLEQIFNLNKSKVIVFPYENLLSEFEKKISKKPYQKFTGKTSIIGSKNSATNNIICSETSINGVDICTDMWVFYGFPSSRAHSLLRTTGENIVYTHNQ